VPANRATDYRGRQTTMTAIIVKDLSVDIPIFDVASSSIRQLLLRRAVGGQVAQQGSHVVVNALKQIGFEARDGDRIGLVGPNGAGKTTLLRVLADIYPPTTGTVEVVGRVSPMFDNNLGMNADATGLENIRLCGLLWGLTPAQIENSIDDIAEFTELGGYLNMPVRTYSQGMQMRLAFAIVTIREPEILLLDESIGVGDAQFFDKASARLQSLVDRSRILVVASHSDPMIRRLCNKAIWLHAGRLMQYDEVDRVLEAYSKNEARPVTENIEETRCHDAVDPAEGHAGVQSEPDVAQPTRNVTMKAVSAGNAFLGGVVLILSIALGYLYFGLSPTAGPAGKVSQSSSPTPVSPPSPAQKGSGDNLIWPSEDFTHANWRPAGVAKVTTGVRAPNGENAASKLIESPANGRHFIEVFLTGVRPGSDYVLSLYAKADKRAGIRFEMRDSQQPGRYGTAVFELPNVKEDVFNLRSDGAAATAGDVVKAGVKAVQNGWYRCWATMRFNSVDAVFTLGPVTAEGAHMYKGDGESGLLIWGAQLEPGSKPGAYVVTTMGPVTKNP
jgi:ABC-2 type transport system ATP-binding protein